MCYDCIINGNYAEPRPRPPPRPRPRPEVGPVWGRARRADFPKRAFTEGLEIPKCTGTPALAAPSDVCISGALSADDGEVCILRRSTCNALVRSVVQSTRRDASSAIGRNKFINPVKRSADVSRGEAVCCAAAAAAAPETSASVVAAARDSASTRHCDAIKASKIV